MNSLMTNDQATGLWWGLSVGHDMSVHQDFTEARKGKQVTTFTSSGCDAEFFNGTLTDDINRGADAETAGAMAEMIAGRLYGCASTARMSAAVALQHAPATAATKLINK